MTLRTTLFRAAVVVPLVGALPWSGAAAADEAPDAARTRSLVVYGVEVEGDLSDTSRRAEWRARAAMLTDALRRGLDSPGLYDVLDAAPATDILDGLSDRSEVHACTECLLAVSRRLGADRILAPWVFRVSNLILALHLEVRDGGSGEILYRKSLDFRGDNDRAWLKAGDYFVRWLKEDAPATR